MGSEGSREKKVPFLSRSIRATDEEWDFLKFIRDNYCLPEINGGYNEFLCGKLKRLIDEKNALISQGENSKKLEEIIYKIANLEVYVAKWEAMIKRYEERK